MMNITLPFPPSINRLWRNVSGRTLLSKVGRQYRAAAVAQALRSGVALGCAPVEIAIDAWLPDRRRRDADNLAKAPLDALVHSGVIDDDSQIVYLSIRKCGVDRMLPRLEISINAADQRGLDDPN